MNSTTVDVLKNIGRFTSNHDQWELLSKCPEWIVRMACARNIYIEERDVQSFMNDPHHEVRASVAGYTKSERVLFDLIKDENYLVRAAAIMNQFAPQEIISIGLTDSARTNRELAQMYEDQANKTELKDLNEPFRQLATNQERLAKGGVAMAIRETVLLAMDPDFPVSLNKKPTVKEQLSLALNPNANSHQLTALTSKEAKEAREYNPVGRG
jgi:hypothetical protein